MGGDTLVLEPTLARLPDGWDAELEYETPGPSIVETAELSRALIFADVIGGLRGEIEREGEPFLL